MKIKHVVLVLITILMMTGCSANSRYLVNDKKEPIKHEKTGHTLEKAILCKPSEDSEIYKIYKQHEDQLDFKLDSISYCKNYDMSKNKVDSIWQTIFIKPTGWLILKVGYLVNNLGLGLILVGILIRIVLMPFQLKSTKQSLSLKKASPELERLEKKYKDKKDNESMMAKSSEMMLIYKKYKVNPMLGCLLAFIQLPIFFAFIQAIYKIPVIYEEKFLSLNMGMTPSVGISNGNYVYILLLLLIIFSTYFSFKYSMSQTPTMNKDMEKQSKTMLYVMMVVITMASFTLPTAIALYWITTNAFIAGQTFITNLVLGEKPKSGVNIKDKLKIKEGMKYGKNNK